MREMLPVDVEALQEAVHNACIPASLSFPIFDAAGLRQKYSDAPQSHPAALRSAEEPQRENTVPR